jgi:NAD-dependent dihydropyrimidine dehydrogenase PreA subunit
MYSRTAVLEFQPENVEKPLVSRAIRSFEVEINILQAHITPSETGRLLAVFEGTEEQVAGAIAFLRSGGVTVSSPDASLVHDRDLCTGCGACAGQCPSHAFGIDPVTAGVVLDPDRCIACGICILACPYGAVRPGAAFVTPEVGA